MHSHLADSPINGYFSENISMANTEVLGGHGVLSIYTNNTLINNVNIDSTYGFGFIIFYE